MKERFTPEPVVFVIDDDASVRDSLKNLLETVGLHAELFDTAHAFMSFHPPDAPSCLILDVRLPGLTGLEFQNELLKLGFSLPIIFITGHGDIPMSVRAMKLGAVEFLTKPFRDQDLLEAVRVALDRDRRRRRDQETLATLRVHFESLTVREKQVIGFVTAGLSNKQIAAKMGISDATAKVHRANIMRKMQARSLVELLRMADLLGAGNLQHGAFFPTMAHRATPMWRLKILDGGNRRGADLTSSRGDLTRPKCPTCRAYILRSCATGMSRRRTSALGQKLTSEATKKVVRNVPMADIGDLWPAPALQSPLATA